MKRWFSFFMLMFSSLLWGVNISVHAESLSTRATEEQWWEQIVPLFPQTSGVRRAYVVSGLHSTSGEARYSDMKDQQQVSDLVHEVLLVEEIHPTATTPDASDIMPVLYYLREGNLVRETVPTFADERGTHVLVTGVLSSPIVSPVSRWQQALGGNWQSIDVSNRGSATPGTLAHHVHSTKRESILVKAGMYKDCIPVEKVMNDEDGSRYRSQEWYAPGVGLVKATVTDMQSGTVIVHKELVHFKSGLSQNRIDVPLGG